MGRITAPLGEREKRAPLFYREKEEEATHCIGGLRGRILGVIGEEGELQGNKGPEDSASAKVRKGEKN